LYNTDGRYFLPNDLHSEVNVLLLILLPFCDVKVRLFNIKTIYSHCTHLIYVLLSNIHIQLYILQLKFLYLDYLTMNINVNVI